MLTRGAMRIAIALLAPLLVASSARAESLEETSYAKVTLAVDGTSIGLLLLGAASEGPDGRDGPLTGTLFGVGALGAAFGTPIVHAVRGHAGRAVASIGLRGAFMWAGATIAISASNCRQSEKLFCELEAAGPGMLLGLVVASAVDAAFMTTETRPATAWQPVISASSHGGHVGLGGTF
jgi:hypothetical protein